MRCGVSVFNLSSFENVFGQLAAAAAAAAAAPTDIVICDVVSGSANS